MALFKSQLVTQVSGSVGGTTYAHTGSGMYMRARSIPVNPNSGNQLAVRASLTSMVNSWNSLSATVRNLWNLWAANTPFTNALGDSFNISGQNAYIGSNTGRGQAISKLGLTIELAVAAPTVFNRGDFTTPGPFTIDATTGLSLPFTEADDWANETDACMLVFQGRPQNLSRQFFKGPYRLVTAIVGDGTTAPTSPKTVSAASLNSLGYGAVAGTNYWIAVAVYRADGRWSTRRVLGPVEAT